MHLTHFEGLPVRLLSNSDQGNLAWADGLPDPPSRPVAVMAGAVFHIPDTSLSSL